MNKREYLLSSRIENLIHDYQNDFNFSWNEFKYQLRNIISDYE